MQRYEARIREILLENGRRKAWINCPKGAIPAPGRYLMGWALDDPEAPLATPLFAEQIATDGFLAAPEIPRSWEPGAQLSVFGPAGKGFSLPKTARRMAALALGNAFSCLTPVIEQALAQGAAVAIWTDLPIESVSASVEINPLNTAAEAPFWADFLIAEMPIERLVNIRQILGLTSETRRLPCPSQALLRTAMPCGGLGACGACAVTAGHGWHLTCQDGPVFELERLL
jgi:hypothetical protein